MPWVRHEPEHVVEDIEGVRLMLTSTPGAIWGTPAWRAANNWHDPPTCNLRRVPGRATTEYVAGGSHVAARVHSQPSSFGDQAGL